MKILSQGREGIPLNNILIIGRAAPNHPSFSGYATSNFLFSIAHWNDHLQDNCEGWSEGYISFLANFIIYMSVENLFCLFVLSEKNTAEKSYYIYITSNNFAISTKKMRIFAFY